MTEHYLLRLARTISENWDEPALTDFYLNEDGTAQDSARGNHYTYGEMYQTMMQLGGMFRQLGLRQGDHIAICGANSANWAVAYLSIAAYQGVVVTVLNSQSTEDIAHQIDFSDSVCLFTDKGLWDELKGQNLPQIKTVIDLENFGVIACKQVPSSVEPATGRAITRYGSTSNPVTIPHGEPDDLAMICFTSGSSGVSKGVMLSYRNLSSNLRFKYTELSEYKIISRNFISFLPLGHIFGLLEELLRPLYIGLSINFINITNLRLDLVACYKIIKPIWVVVVPQMLKSLIDKSMEYTLDENRYNFIYSSLGNNIREIFIGGAGLTIDNLRYLNKLGLPIAIGYGTTECAPSIAVCMSRDYRIGAVGRVVIGAEIMISFDGEILVRGENVMLGYYKDPEATAQKIDKDGWLHTGDRGHIDEDGYLYVEGRIEQDIIVLPNGENIHPEDIEQKINELPEIQESIVVAREGRLVALVLEVLDNLVVLDNLEKRHKALRLKILRNINPQLPMYSQLYDIEFLQEPLKRTAKQTIKRYLYR